MSEESVSDYGFERVNDGWSVKLGFYSIRDDKR